MKEEKKDAVLISPPTTPGSLQDHEPFLESRVNRAAKTLWYKRFRPPYALIFISLLQIVLYCTLVPTHSRLFYFDPLNQKEAWRFITYMFIHGSVVHITLNVVLQCIISYRLEKNQGSVRTVLLYFLGGATGALCASCLRPDLISGASAGVYALLTSHISHVLVNYKSSREKLVTFSSVIIMIVSDTAYYFFHARYMKNLIISEGAHIGGAIAGMLLGLIIYKRKDDKLPQDCLRHRCSLWIALLAYVFVIVACVLINHQVQKCTSLELRRTSYVYFC